MTLVQSLDIHKKRRTFALTAYDSLFPFARVLEQVQLEGVRHTDLKGVENGYGVKAIFYIKPSLLLAFSFFWSSPPAFDRRARCG